MKKIFDLIKSLFGKGSLEQKLEQIDEIGDSLKKTKVVKKKTSKPKKTATKPQPKVVTKTAVKKKAVKKKTK